MFVDFIRKRVTAKSRDLTSALGNCRAEMYAGRVTCRPMVDHGKCVDSTDRRTDVRPLHYAPA